MSESEQQRLYRLVVEQSLEGVWVIDKANRTTFMNASMARMLGHAPADLVGRLVFELMDDNGRLVAEAMLERCRLGIAEAHDFLFRRKDGSDLWARLTVSPITDENGAVGAFALVTDLTEVKARERESERLSQIVDASHNEVYLLDEELRLEHANEAALRNLDYTLDAARRLCLVDLMPQHTRESFLRFAAPLLSGETQKVNLQTSHLRKDGSLYLVDGHLQLMPGPRPVFLAVVDDVTEKDQKGEARRVGEARFRALIEQSLDLVVLADADGRFFYVSPSVKNVLGYDQEEFLKLGPFDLNHPEDLPIVGEAFGRSVRGESTVDRIEFRLRHKDGRWRTVSANARNFLDDPRIRALTLNARDITDQRHLEEQLQQSQRLESIGRLAGGVAHDFNNILTAILGSAAFLAQEPGLSDVARGDVKEIHEAGVRASEVTNQLLAFARRRVIRPHAVAIDKVIANQERFLRRVIGEHIEMTTHYEPNLWQTWVDPLQVEQIVVNLAVNARDAMKNGGRITFETKNIVLDETVAKAHPDLKPGAYVMVAVSVSHSGDGIGADVLPHSFEPFFTTKSVGAGTERGLAMVYGLVRQSDGHIWVDSEVGVGTTLKLCFPRMATAPAAPEAPSGGSERLLVVEDDATVRQMLVRTLTSAGYTVHAEPNPTMALEWALATRGMFDLLITDVVMPVMSGKQLATRLTAELGARRVLYVSGYTENTVVHRGVLEEGVEFLAKPFSPDELRRRVRAVLDAGV